MASEHTCAFTFGSNLNIRIERALRVDYHRVKRRSFIFDRHEAEHHPCVNAVPSSGVTSVRMGSAAPTRLAQKPCKHRAEELYGIHDVEPCVSES